MHKNLALLALLLVAACATTPVPDTGPYASLNCQQLETERIRLVAELDALPASDDVKIAKARAEIEAIGTVQVEKGCAG